MPLVYSLYALGWPLGTFYIYIKFCLCLPIKKKKKNFWQTLVLFSPSLFPIKRLWPEFFYHSDAFNYNYSSLCLVGWKLECVYFVLEDFLGKGEIAQELQQWWGAFRRPYMSFSWGICLSQGPFYLVWWPNWSSSTLDCFLISEEWKSHFSGLH